MTTDTKPLPTIGIDRVYYALLLTDTDSGSTYASSIALPGAVELTETPNADAAFFHADDAVYLITAQPGEVQVPLTIAGIDPEKFAQIMGAVYTAASAMLEESQTDVAVELALAYRNQLPNGKYEYVWLMAGIFTKVAKTFNTKGASIAYNTKPVQFNARALVNGGLLIRKFSSDDPNAPVGLTDAALESPITGWFSDPNFVPTAPGTPVADFAGASGSGSGEIDATWTMPTGATSQKIQVKNVVDDTWTDAEMETALTASSATGTIVGLTPSNAYDIRLVVVSGANNSISNEDTGVIALA